MERLDHAAIRSHSERLSRALQTWEAQPYPAHASMARAQATKVQQQLKEWENAGVYPSNEIRMLSDQVQHVHARLAIADKEKTRGY